MRFTFLVSLAVLVSTSMALADDAKSLAEKLTAEGAANFSARKAQALTDSYTDGAKISLVSLDDSTGRAKVDVREGRSDIRSLYEKLFEGNEPIEATNTVDYARLIGSDFLTIAGTFEIKRGDNTLRVAFVQLRVKQNGLWQIESLELVYIPNL